MQYEKKVHLKITESAFDSYHQYQFNLWRTMVESCLKYFGANQWVIVGMEKNGMFAVIDYHLHDPTYPLIESEFLFNMSKETKRNQMFEMIRTITGYLTSEEVEVELIIEDEN